MMVDEFFNSSNVRLPIILKKMAGEDEDNHRDRVRMYMLACPDNKFSDIADLIDPQNDYHTGFFNLYNECQK